MKVYCESAVDSTDVEPTVIPTRTITPAKIDPDALKIVRRLRKFGYAAYLVGGCVRDLLLRRHPKDFDVATEAKPTDLRKLFRNCRLIGRRFRLAHIYFREKVIETATFRAAAQEVKEGQEDLLIRSDNVFGTEQEDANRRDFTINALFYDPVNRTLIDYVGGLEDLVERVIRFIGKPDVRTREDPVRILRAIKFAGLLDFSIEPETWQAIVDYRFELQKCAPPRILEEIFKILKGGRAEDTLRLMWRAGVLEVILPEVAAYLSRALERGEERDPGAGLFAYLRALDQMDRSELSHSVLMSCLVLHPTMDVIGSQECAAYQVPDALTTQWDVSGCLLQRMVERLRLPKWEAERIQQLITTQRRLFGMRKNQPVPHALLCRSYFGEALDLFEIGVHATRDGMPTLRQLRAALHQATPKKGPTAHPRRSPSPSAAPAPTDERPKSRSPRRRRRSRHRAAAPQPAEG